MFIFYGCSFTYGQGLQYYWLVENTHLTWSDMENFGGSKIQQEFNVNQCNPILGYSRLLFVHL